MCSARPIRIRTAPRSSRRMANARSGRAAGLVGIRAGRFRTPFGISTRSDHAYTGFMRAPMIRYDDYFALSNNFLEHGADSSSARRRHISRPASADPWMSAGAAPSRLRYRAPRSGLLSLGDHRGSHYRAMPYQPEYFAKGRAVFTGVDVRWMYNGIQLRGEFLSGRPFDGTTTTGGYIDLLVHRVGMGPVTAVARLERLDYDTIPEFVLFARRAMAGARIRIPGGLTAQIAAGHQWRQQIQRDRTAFDFTVTYSLRRDIDTHRP